MRLITTPLFYVNGSPHIGHAYSAVLADAMNRWTRQSRLLIGTDEHGQKIASAAAKVSLNTDPKQFCDGVSKSFQDCFDVLSVKYDTFIRTTEKRHEKTVYDLWSRIKKDISLHEYQGWYCASDEAFVAKKLVNIESKTLFSTGHNVEWISEPEYRFSFDPIKLEQEVFDRCEFIPGNSKKRELKEMFLEFQEQPYVSVSRLRSRVPWALQVPNDPTQSIYVWLDALTGYITGSNSILNPDPMKEPFIVDNFQKGGVTHVIGKDILKFHACYWMAFLLSAGIKLPDRIVCHAHWTVNRTKMSKSLGNVIDPNIVLSKVCKGQVDMLRYFLLRDGRLENDADYSENTIIDRCDTDLVNNLGNLVSRCCAEAMWNCQEEISPKTSDDQNERRKKVIKEVDFYYKQADFARGLETLMEFLRLANADFHERQPWVQAKFLKKGSLSDRKDHVEKLNIALGNGLDACRTAAILMSPVTPKLSSDIFSRLNISLNSEVDLIQYGMSTISFSKPKVGSPILLQRLGVTSFQKK